MSEAKVFAVQDKAGAITRLIEADSVKQAKAFITPEISKPSALTVAKLVQGGMKIEKAQS